MRGYRLFLAAAFAAAVCEQQYLSVTLSTTLANTDNAQCFTVTFDACLALRPMCGLSPSCNATSSACWSSRVCSTHNAAVMLVQADCAMQCTCSWNVLEAPKLLVSRGTAMLTAKDDLEDKLKARSSTLKALVRRFSTSFDDRKPSNPCSMIAQLMHGVPKQCQAKHTMNTVSPP